MIEHTHHEFTSLCPLTGHPDFASVTVRYVADRWCVELKSLKLYFHAFRNQGIFFEEVTNRICDALGGLLAPRRLTVVTDWKGLTVDLHPASRPSGGRQRGAGKGSARTGSGLGPAPLGLACWRIGGEDAGPAESEGGRRLSGRQIRLATSHSAARRSAATSGRLARRSTPYPWKPPGHRPRSYSQALNAC